MQILAHITFNEIAVFAGVYLLGIASGLAIAWQLLRAGGRR